MKTCRNAEGENTSTLFLVLNKTSLSQVGEEYAPTTQEQTKDLSYAHYHLLIGQDRRLARLIFINAFGLCSVFSRIHFLIWGLPVVSLWAGLEGRRAGWEGECGRPLNHLLPVDVVHLTL